MSFKTFVNPVILDTTIAFHYFEIYMAFCFHVHTFYAATLGVKAPFLAISSATNTAFNAAPRSN